MQNIKLHEATKQFGISNKLAMFFLWKKNLSVKSHSSVITMEQLELLREFASDKEKFSYIYGEFNRVEKEKKRKAKKAKIAEAEKIPGKKEEIKKEPEIKKEEPEIKKKPKIEVKIKKEKPGKDNRKVHEVRKVEPGITVEKVEPVEKEVKKHEKERTERIEKEIKIVKEKEHPRLEEHKKKIDRSEKRPIPLPKAAKRKHVRPGIKPIMEKRKVRPEPVPKAAPPPAKPKPKVYNLPELIQISNYISIKELAEKLNLKLKDIEERMGMLKKEFITNRVLDVEEIKEICKEFKVELDIVSFEDSIFYEHIEKFNAKLTPRAPVVTVMGHVDHGKTTLLDTLRKTRVAEREAGGITQKIGAYKLTNIGSDIIFLDTPGHEAFTNIRARGAQVTDIVILVVAANDGVKPQTIEAINHAQAAEVPIVVTINKIDLPGADPDKFKQELANHNVVLEEWGGDVVSVEISAKYNQNLDSLLEMIGIVSEMLELKAYKDIPARGTIIESRLDPKLGCMGTVLIQHGQIKRGNSFICGDSVGKVKSIFDEQGNVLNDAEAILPVEIMGFENIPEAGERFQVIDDVEKARKVIEIRKLKEKETKKEEVIAEKKLSLQNLFEKLEENKTKVFPIIMKTDNFSSGEVLENILLKHNQEKLKINIVHKGIGNITESDILLASTSGSIIVGFNVKVPQKIVGLAKREQIEIKLYTVIYHLIEDIEKAVKGEIEPEYIETQIGQVEVLQIFKISKIGIIAGCLVKEGKVTNKSKIKVFRKEDFVFEGEVETLRRIKNDVSEVNAGTECGIKIKNFNAIGIGDILEVYETKVKE